MDTNRDTALTLACLAGRQIIVKELLELGALVHEKNRDLMTPLQLAVVDESPGNGEVVRMLVEAGAEIDARCWDITPLMSAAAGGHYWATEVLLELGADTEIRNGYAMMAMDYARDQETQQLIYDFMRGNMLPDAGLLQRSAAARAAQQQYKKHIPGEQDKGPRLFQSVQVRRDRGLLMISARLTFDGGHVSAAAAAWLRLGVPRRAGRVAPGLLRGWRALRRDPTGVAEARAAGAARSRLTYDLGEFYIGRRALVGSTTPTSSPPSRLRRRPPSTPRHSPRRWRPSSRWTMPTRRATPRGSLRRTWRRRPRRRRPRRRPKRRRSRARPRPRRARPPRWPLSRLPTSPPRAASLGHAAAPRPRAV